MVCYIEPINMNPIIIKTQEQLDTLPKTFQEFTIIRIESTEWITVEARENSKVVAYGNSTVVARGNVCVWNQSDESIVTLFAFAVAFLFRKAKAAKKSKTSTIIRPVNKTGEKGWLEDHAVKTYKSHVVLFKRVSKDFLSQEGTKNETNWKIGETLTHPEWHPKDRECGTGKYHACPRPYFCDEFMDNTGDRYVAIEIDKKDLYAWPDPTFPHKIAFRKGTVLHEVDRFGEKL